MEYGDSRMWSFWQPGGKWRQPGGIPTRVDCAGFHTPCILDLLKDSKELSSISDCFGDQKAIKTPKLNTIWLEFITRVLNMLIGLKGDNYYSKVFKRVNYKLWNSTFWVVISDFECQWREWLRTPIWKLWLWMPMALKTYESDSSKRLWL